MPDLTTDKLRLLLCAFSALWLGACANTSAPSIELAKGAPTGSSSTLYSGQTPEVPPVGDVIASLEQQLSANPKDVQAYLNLGVAYRHVERFEEALQVFEQASAISEQPHVVQNEIGILHRAQGDFARAEAAYLAVLSAAPDFHDAHYNLGILYDLYMRRPLDAQKHYQAYISNAPEGDKQVEKWLVDLERRHQIGASASAGVVGE